MKRDLFIWSIVTAVIAAVVYYILKQFTFNIWYFLVALAVIVIVSVVVFVRGNPEQPFKSGGVIALVGIISMVLAGNAGMDTLVGAITNISILIVTFLIGGAIGYFLSKKEGAPIKWSQ